MGFLGSITSGITSAFKGIGSIVSNMNSSSVSKFSPSALNQIKDLFSSTVNSSSFTPTSLPGALPYPGSQLSKTQYDDFVKQIKAMVQGPQTSTVDGQSLTLPGLAQSAGTIAQSSQALSGTLGSGTFNGSINSALAAGGFGQSGGLFDDGLSDMQKKVVAKATEIDPKQGALMALQMQMENQKRLMELMSNLMKMMHETSSSIIANIR